MKNCYKMNSLWLPVVAIVPIEHQEVHDDSHRSSSHDVTASSTSKEVTPSLTSRYGSRPKQVKVNCTIQPVIAGGSSRSKKVKPLRISHKLKERIEEGKERVKEDLTIKQSLVKMMPVHSLATNPVTVIDKKPIHECTGTTTITTHSLTSKEAKGDFLKYLQPQSFPPRMSSYHKYYKGVPVGCWLL